MFGDGDERFSAQSIAKVRTRVIRSSPATPLPVRVMKILGLLGLSNQCIAKVRTRVLSGVLGLLGLLRLLGDYQGHSCY
jgi:hypothetical protein